jgi:excisionase family DNA binding protein
MDKICIVKRRKKGQESVIEVPQKELTDEINGTKNEVPVFEEVTGDKPEVISIHLTPEQSAMVQSLDYIRSLSMDKQHGVKLDISRDADGKILFNFHFKPVYTVKMLNTKSVCEMLQIGKSFLRKLIKTKQLKSYKIGRRRRFSLEDVLEYLSRNAEI